MQLFSKLFLAFGDPCWWPGETPFEVAIGAILTQNTAWSNVETAIGNLKKAEMLDPAKVIECSPDRLAGLIHATGYHNQKTEYIKVISNFIVEELGGDISSLSSWDTKDARTALLSLKGVGNETADSILCYAVRKPVFVVDVYTLRIFARMDPRPIIEMDVHEPLDPMAVRSEIMTSLKGDALLYNRLHALLVILAKEYCRKNPKCGACPVHDICRTGVRTMGSAEGPNE
ncbi:MAG: hypothetical protein JXA22_03525 [Candidatus Thermoplasmatota archaeon]|nr:hypothetical protein [Candidatus Thermoplasmatota archaeon]